MAIQSLGDLAQSILLRRHTASIKDRLQTYTEEVTTGRAADMAAQVSGDFVPLASLTGAIARLEAYAAATSEATIFAESTQTALSVLDNAASDMAPTLLQVGNANNQASIDAAAAESEQKFRTVITTMNTRLGDRTLFSGKATDGPALADADTILTTLDGLVATLTSAVDIEQAVNDWFDDPLGFGTTGYLGADPLDPIAIAAGETADIGVTANEPGIVDTLKGLALAALLNRGVLSSNRADRFNLATRAGESLITAQPSRSQLQARVGVMENQIANAETRNSAEETALDIARARVVSVDPYDTATALEEARTQLETLYAITARLSTLRLTDFLR